jgi:hypothetical protein
VNDPLSVIVMSWPSQICFFDRKSQVICNEIITSQSAPLVVSQAVFMRVSDFYCVEEDGFVGSPPASCSSKCADFVSLSVNI